MTRVTVKLVHDLRKKSGAGLEDCTQALMKTNGDIEASIEFLRKKGLCVGVKRAGVKNVQLRFILIASLVLFLILKVFKYI